MGSSKAQKCSHTPCPGHSGMLCGMAIPRKEQQLLGLPLRTALGNKYRRKIQLQHDNSSPHAMCCCKRGYWEGHGGCSTIAISLQHVNKPGNKGKSLLPRDPQGRMLPVLLAQQFAVMLLCGLREQKWGWSWEQWEWGVGGAQPWEVPGRAGCC